MLLPSHPILAVSYVDETRDALCAVLSNNGVTAMPCASFCDAETLALQGLYSGMLVDLPSMVKSKGEEKIVAYTLANFFPILRVRTMGGMLVPMAMPGSAKQDKSLDDFLHKTCIAFAARPLRAYRRHPVNLATMIHSKNEDFRGFTLNISWGGLFVVDVNAEKFHIGDIVTILFPEFGATITAVVRRIIPWGTQRYVPGIGLSYYYMGEKFESIISGITRTRKEFDRDRLTA